MAGRPKLDNTERSRSWFCVLNNPQEVYSGSPEEVAQRVLDEWIKDCPTRAGAVAYCISAEGLPHLHMVLEDANKVAFNSLKKAYPKAHLEPTRGTKEQAEEYIQKKGKFEEKGESILFTARHGEIKGAQGTRRDLEIIKDLIEQGKTPKEIFACNFSYRRYSSMINDEYYDKRYKETGITREVKTYWHVGESGSGKSYEYVKLCEKHGDENVYFYTDYESGGMDHYCGESTLFMDEFRGQMRFSTLMNWLDKYRVQVHARYSNKCALWTEVHIASVLPPERVYSNMVKEHGDLDSYQQLMRRIDFVVYHFKNPDGTYGQYTQPASEYTNYEDLERLALNKEPPAQLPLTVVEDSDNPFMEDVI